MKEKKELEGEIIKSYWSNQENPTESNLVNPFDFLNECDVLPSSQESNNPLGLKLEIPRNSEITHRLAEENLEIELEKLEEDERKKQELEQKEKAEKLQRLQYSQHTNIKRVINKYLEDKITPKKLEELAKENEGIGNSEQIHACTPIWKESSPKTLKAKSALVSGSLIIRSDGSTVSLCANMGIGSQLLRDSHQEGKSNPKKLPWERFIQSVSMFKKLQ